MWRGQGEDQLYNCWHAQHENDVRYSSQWKTGCALTTYSSHMLQIVLTTYSSLLPEGEFRRGGDSFFSEIQERRHEKSEDN
jgi:hypothetical protein